MIERTEIKGTAYAVARMDPLRGGRIAARVGRILAAALADSGGIADLISAYRNGAADQLDEGKLIEALAGGMRGLDTDALYDAALEMCKGQVFAGERKLHDDTAFNAHFREQPDHLLPVLAWVLKVNCAGFFGLGARA